MFVFWMTAPRVVFKESQQSNPQLLCLHIIPLLLKPFSCLHLGHLAAWSGQGTAFNLKPQQQQQQEHQEGDGFGGISGDRSE